MRHRFPRVSLVLVASVASTLVPVCGAQSVELAPSALTCATNDVAHWSTPRLARTVVVVSVASTSTSIMVDAARQGFGGLILLGTSVPATLVSTLRSLPSDNPSGLQLAVMTDDEGGGVIRTPALTGTWPWAQVMGNTMSTAQIGATGRRIGLALRAAGVTMDLAPVADVDGRAVVPGPSNPDGLRSFGGRPVTDGLDAAAFAHGLQSAGVVATAKHFPGLGGANENTDVGPATTRSWSQLQTTGLVPFRTLIADGVQAVMMSNATVPGLTTGPASLSPTAVAALRGLGFRGLIITDSLGAGALSAVGLSPAAAAPVALAAGVDQVLGPPPSSPAAGLRTATQMAASINAAVVKGQLSRAQVATAAATVLATVNPGICRST